MFTPARLDVVPALLILCLGAAPNFAGTHPTLLLTPDDLPRLRHACGIAGYAEQADPPGRAGRRAREFQTLRSHFAARVDPELLPGELSAAAFLHLIDPDDPLDRQRMSLINSALREPLWATSDAFERLLALDWCWTALEPEARREFILTMRKRAVLLTPADSPLDHRVFRDKLLTLAFAVAIDKQDDPSPSWAHLRACILTAAREYFDATFPTFIRWRGLSPTSPSQGPWEERDTALALELASRLLERDIWDAHRDTVGRWLEHYIFASLSHPALQHHFIRDDSSHAALSPAADWDEMLPLTAHLIAVRTRDPAAAFIASRVEQRLRGPAAEPLALAWQWIPIAFDTAGIPCCDFARLPVARNFQGAVVFRGRHGSMETAIWIEAGQPYLRRGQHFDAGHFLICAGGQLTVGSGEDIAYEAIPTKRGTQHLGNRADPFDFEQYFSASIAHNCLLLHDPVRVPRWHGQRYEPAGGQRTIEGTCTEFQGDLDGHPRQTARQLAYGTQENNAYLALDLQPAYDSRVVSSYTREFIFVHGRILLVLDRVATPRARTELVWVLNLPAPPTVAGHQLADENRVAGGDKNAGIWRYDSSPWLHWINRDGGLWMKSLLPELGSLHVVGGPATKSVITDGPHVGLTYVGGQPDGYEYRVRPVGRNKPENAWYRLGAPTMLGSCFGQTPNWGRLELEPGQPGRQHLFVVALVIDSNAETAPPVATVNLAGPSAEINLTVGNEQIKFTLPPGNRLGGFVESTRPDSVPWVLPTRIESDGPLLTQ
ncbi:MAG: heparinase II/III family protein [Planctomycetota bacterium]